MSSGNIQTTSEEEQIFIGSELRETLRSLWRAIPAKRWLNDPERLWLGNNKLKQLMVAKEVGLKIPETLISSRSKDVLDFAERYGGDVISKAVRSGFFIAGSTTNLIFTSRLENEDLSAIAESEFLVPAILQPRLEKKYDLRITIVGDSVFPVALFSQDHAETSVDWRTWGTTTSVNLIHERFDLPACICDKCLSLNQRLGLNFSCIDMVLNKNGEYFFLEVNPNGEWAWIEEAVGFPIRDRIIDHLMRKQADDGE